MEQTVLNEKTKCMVSHSAKNTLDLDKSFELTSSDCESEHDHHKHEEVDKSPTEVKTKDLKFGLGLQMRNLMNKNGDAKIDV